METKTLPTIVQEIKNQIGNKAFYMLGATNLTYSKDEPNYLSFRIRGSKKVNYIKITLNSLDLYDCEFGKIHGNNYKIVNQVDNIYNDMLHKTIESNTGLYTSF